MSSCTCWGASRSRRTGTSTALQETSGARRLSVSASTPPTCSEALNIACHRPAMRSVSPKAFDDIAESDIGCGPVEGGERVCCCMPATNDVTPTFDDHRSLGEKPGAGAAADSRCCWPSRAPARRLTVSGVRWTSGMLAARLGEPTDIVGDPQQPSSIAIGSEVRGDSVTTGAASGTASRIIFAACSDSNGFSRLVCGGELCISRSAVTAEELSLWSMSSTGVRIVARILSLLDEALQLAPATSVCVVAGFIVKARFAGVNESNEPASPAL